MKWLKRILLGVVVLAVIVVAIGWMLPSGFKVQRSVEIAAPPSKIYPLVVAPRQWKKWTVWNERDPAMAIEYSGPESGVGAKWSWTSKTEGNGSIDFTAAVPDQRVDYALAFPDVGMTSRGQVILQPAGTGTRVTMVNEGDVGGNPLNRYFALMMDSMVGPDFEAGLKNLKALAERS
ncbi:MAG: SRPBCC family protein [Burkholderiaceae bacterium]